MGHSELNEIAQPIPLHCSVRNRNLRGLRGVLFNLSVVDLFKILVGVALELGDAVRAAKPNQARRCGAICFRLRIKVVNRLVTHATAIQLISRDNAGIQWIRRFHLVNLGLLSGGRRGGGLDQ